MRRPTAPAAPTASEKDQRMALAAYPRNRAGARSALRDLGTRAERLNLFRSRRHSPSTMRFLPGHARRDQQDALDRQAHETLERLTAMKVDGYEPVPFERHNWTADQ